MRGKAVCTAGCVPIGWGQVLFRTSWASPRLSMVKETAALKGWGQGGILTAFGEIEVDLESRFEAEVLL